MKNKKILTASEMGRKGGLARVKKGLAMLTRARRREIAQLGWEKSVQVRREKSA